ncbi:glyoxalase superfamily protein [Microvirga rosea]|uniref:glyoxalase superfamily protein n=1 Tax=Microvirga rosea TaxID=2715425 RepID=UPI001D0BA485|nr:glyoxalase superfamily protein [Microvirga rosea]MCB8820337.1 VOC family protein [Microvirga rosea]
MRTFHDAKVMATALRTALKDRQCPITHSEALEIVAKQFGLENWNVLAARIDASPSKPEIRFEQTAPILRIFDEEKAKAFYVGFLGFTLDWEHRFGPDFPLYAQVSRSGLTLHLSGHHGDATPGSTVYVTMRGVRHYQRELADKHYPNMRPGLEEAAWGTVMTVTDPFSNNIRFCEPPRR